MPTDTAVLQESLEKHNAAFESLLRLIPAKYYLVPDDVDEQLASKYMKNSKKQKAPKQAIKEASKKAKKEKLDPANNKTILDIQSEALAARTQDASQNKAAASRKRKSRADDSGSEHSDSGDDDHPRSADEDEEHGMDVDMDAPPVPMPESGGIEALREKLHARMAQLRNKGKGRPYRRAIVSMLTPLTSQTLQKYTRRVLV
ncbi:hypothetical protein NUW54_g11586 [Trametes sanguinea]|uniref:Uncharacterized protein n=1 Tax=Trametes sanguinea TaxID=158606 RepID=A0ACC1NBT4_9APHY|nr:hypothetical protein NUW54_g11586 [Trametes sanguinea]